MGEVRTPARQIVEAEIRAKGPITFARFMEIALYGEEGYYTKVVKAGADYATSPQVHPAFGALIAGWLFRAWCALGEPERFDVVEMGAGDGGLVEDVLGAACAPFVLRTFPPPAGETWISRAGRGENTDDLERFRDALRYKPFDIRPRGAVRGIDELSEMGSIVGCVISNELLDAFPTNVFTVRGGEVLECFVDVGDGGELVFVEGDVSSDEVTDRVGGMASMLPEGYRGEVNLGIVDWTAGVRRVLERGYVLTIDYGHEREMLYHPLRTEGSLRCYRGHMLGQNPFRDVGLQDITAHVDFAAVDGALRGVGFDQIAPLSSQRDFLFDLGIDAYIREVRKELAESSELEDVRRLRVELRGLNALVDVRGLGAFKVAQHGICAGTIDVSEPEGDPVFQRLAMGTRHLGMFPYD